MRFVDEFRSAGAVRELAREVAGPAQEAAGRLGRPLRFMEVCGGHTMALHRFGIPALLPAEIELLSGPGCPVCVTSANFLDRAVETGADPAVILTTFGDLYRVPGTDGSLEDAAAGGIDVRIVYSARDALRMARDEPDRQVVFVAIGFETTAPGTAATIQEASSLGVGNFGVLCGHKTMPGALRALVDAPQVALDGFILPGHVSTITGPGPYEFLARDCGVACCVSGFEPTDMLMAILSLSRQMAAGSPALENAYPRAVRRDGNPLAQRIVDEVFEPCDDRWRGLGVIAGSGLAVRPEWSAHAVEPPDPQAAAAEPEGCRCPQVLRGIVRPTDCPLFGLACTPDSPVGACMVSSEGACAAHYRYGAPQWAGGSAGAQGG